jgi:hypothetical protein
LATQRFLPKIEKASGGEMARKYCKKLEQMKNASHGTHAKESSPEVRCFTAPEFYF